MLRAHKLRLAAVALAIVFSIGGHAAELRRSELTPSVDTTAIVTLITDGERRRLSLAGIESVGLHEAELRHFEGPEGRFAGVRLMSLLEDQGVDDFQRLRLVAEDGYSVFLNREALRDKTYLLATRLDGDPIPRGSLGPLMLIVPEDAEAVLDGHPSMTQWIWGIVELQAL